jgi:outer membrane protein assembly factor BamB
MNIPRAYSVVAVVALASIASRSAAKEPNPVSAPQESKQSVAVDPLDWPQWRGPEMNGISREKGLVSKWSPSGENVLWKNTDIATRSTPIIMRGKLYVLCRNHPDTTKEGEKVVCVDAETGDKIWENAFNVFLTDVPAERVAWSSVVGDPTTGNVFALGVCGVFQCLDGETGKTLWTHSMSEEYGMIHTYGGRTNLPIVFEDLVIISCVMTGWGEYAVPAHRFIAFDKRTGQPVWITSTRLRPLDTTYSSPSLAVFNGQAAIVAGSGDGAVYAIQPRTGKIIWKYDASMRGINTPPLVVGTDVFCSHSEENLADKTIMGAFFRLDGTGSGDVTKAKERWNVTRIMAGRAQPLLINDRLYTIDDGGLLLVLDPANGSQIARQKLGTIMMGSPVYGDGKIYAGERSNFYILEPTENGVKVLQRIRFNPEQEDVSGSPAISHGRIYIPTSKAMYCVGKRDQPPSADPRPTPPTETPAAADTKPAQLLIVPIESLLGPGQSQRLEARVYNANGRFLKSVPAKFSLKGPGAINSSGEFTADKSAAHTATIVTAEADGLTAAARVRVVPPLPWSFDMTDKQVPVTWIGAAYRHQVREEDGNPMLVKITTIPKGTRSQCWMGPWDMHDYTVQADMKGSIKNDKMPDMGLVNQRYTLDLMGSTKQLQIRSWTSRLELRFAKTIPLAYEPNQWYTIKFQATNEDGRVVLRGKVWPRDKSEPSAWTIEAVDEAPNVVGSPGMFGNASDAEILIDNVKVYANPPGREAARS